MVTKPLRRWQRSPSPFNKSKQEFYKQFPFAVHLNKKTVTFKAKKCQSKFEFDQVL